jgi:hypothetical protein
MINSLLLFIITSAWTNNSLERPRCQSHAVVGQSILQSVWCDGKRKVLQEPTQKEKQTVSSQGLSQAASFS